MCLYIIEHYFISLSPLLLFSILGFFLKKVNLAWNPRGDQLPDEEGVRITQYPKPGMEAKMRIIFGGAGMEVANPTQTASLPSLFKINSID